MEVVFWLSLLFLVYVFFGYPLTLFVRGRFGQPVLKRYIEPKVSVVVIARNEARTIEQRLLNLFNLDYPRENLQIVVALDGSTDGTDVIVQRYRDRVDIVHLRQHRGKAAAINSAMVRATGEIVVFADARQSFHADAVRELVANFADNRVGAASGELILVDESRRESNEAVSVYWKYEKFIRSLESRIHSVVGATGAIYAIRRRLFVPLPDNTILDDVMIPMRIVLLGKRVVFDSDARAYDAVSCCPAAEYNRKVRTLTGNYQLLARMPELLIPYRNPVLWQFLSHKVGRLIAPWAMLTLFVSNALLVGASFYSLIFVGQSVWYACAALGHVEMRRQAGEVVLPINHRRRAA